MQLKKQRISKENIRKVKKTSGVYIYFNKEGKTIYIGKSISLKNRIQSYFSSKLEPKTLQMISEATKFSTIEVLSELEALLLEARLVKKYKPKYNSQLRDDKNPLYIKITPEEYPRVLTARKKDAKEKKAYYFGPFPSSKNVKDVLRMLRKVFPYSQHKIEKRACFYSQIGLCNPCPNVIAKLKGKKRLEQKRVYRKNVRNIQKILSGKLDIVRKGLEKKMLKYSKEEKFEEAKAARNQLQKLSYITQPVTSASYYLKNPNHIEDVRKKEMDELRNLLISLGYTRLRTWHRIECYDVAHLAGSSPTASMVTFINGEPEKKYYRHFRIRQKKSQSDTDSLREAIKRRIKHFSDWGRPDLIIVDGGKGQVSVFVKELSGKNIPVIGIAKREETLVIPKLLENVTSKSPRGGKRKPPQGCLRQAPLDTGGKKAKKGTKSVRIKYHQRKLKPGPAKNLIQRIRNEAHRFAQRYHHELIAKELFTKKI